MRLFVDLFAQGIRQWAHGNRWHRVPWFRAARSLFSFREQFHCGTVLLLLLALMQEQCRKHLQALECQGMPRHCILDCPAHLIILSSHHLLLSFAIRCICRSAVNNYEVWCGKKATTESKARFDRSHSRVTLLEKTKLCWGCVVAVT